MTPLVRRGENAILPRGDHRMPLVYGEMFLQVCRDYPSLPDPRTLTNSEIRFFYEGLRAELQRASRGK